MRVGVQGKAAALLVMLLRSASAAGAADATPPAPAAGGARPTVAVELTPGEATVGDRLALRVDVQVPEGARFVPPPIGPALGDFAVVDGGWSPPEAAAGVSRWTWRGTVVSYRTGPMELPAVRVRVEAPAGSWIEAASEPRTISIRSVLEAEGAAGEEPEIADLKPPASLPPDYRALVVAAGFLALLLAGAGLLWWLHRRYAARLAGVPAPHDPFHRIPPHEWVYAELQKLLERRLPEQGEVPLFFAELARILKRYVGGRYRVDVMERTTGELAACLSPAGADGGVIEAVVELLGRCDLVKFARVVPDSVACRAAIEEAYRVVDVTKPRAAGETSPLEGTA